MCHAETVSACIKNSEKMHSQDVPFWRENLGGKTQLTIYIITELQITMEVSVPDFNYFAINCALLHLLALK